MRVLNVGGNNKNIPIPKCYDGWEHHLLDIDPKGDPDVCCDAQELKKRGEYRGQYDSVYCSHNLEHYYKHKVRDVLEGFFMVCNNDAFVYAAVPHINNVFKAVVNGNLDIHDPLYRLGDGTPISGHDIIFGWGKQIESSGEEFFAHKTAFTPRSLVQSFNEAGFPFVYVSEQGLNLTALAFKQEPTQERLQDVSS